MLVAALVAHPYIEGRLPNDDAVAAEVAAGTMLRGAVHLAAAVASALIILEFLAVSPTLSVQRGHRFLLGREIAVMTSQAAGMTAAGSPVRFAAALMWDGDCSCRPCALRRMPSAAVRVIVATGASCRRFRS